MTKLNDERTEAGMLVLSRKLGEKVVIQGVGVFTASRTASIATAGRNLRPYAGWVVTYATPDPIAPFVQRLLRLLEEHYPGLRATAYAGEPELEVLPPKRTKLAESDRVGREIESLLIKVYRAMEQELDEFSDSDQIS